MNGSSGAETGHVAGAAGDARALALAKLHSIAERALRTNVGRVADLEEALRLATLGQLTDPRRQLAVDTAHQLVGSAGTFGYRRVSDTARRVERFFGDGLAGDDESLEAAADGLRQIRQDLAHGPDEDLGED